MAARKRGGRLRLEATLVGVLPAEGGQRTDYADTIQRGLVLRVTPGGARTWVLLYRAGVRVRRYRLGRWPDVSLAEARRRARRARGLVDSGRDPHGERVEERRARAEAGRAVTLGAVLEGYTAHVIASGDYSASTKDQWPRIIAKDLAPRLAPLRPEDPRVRDAIVSAVQAVTRRGSPVQAGMVLAIARCAWGWAVKRGDIPIGAPYPFLGLRPQRPRRRERFYGPLEIATLWARTSALEPAHRDWWRLLLWTGARSAEISEMGWAEVDLETGRWVHPQTKGGRTLVLTLPRQARGVLAGRRALAPARDALVFPGVGKQAREVLIGRLRVAVPDYRHHDVRRTVRTGLAELGVRHEVAEMVLGHSRGTLVETYDRHLYQAEIAEALQRWADRLEAIVS